MKNNCNFQNLEIGKSIWTFAKKIPLVMRLFILFLFGSISMLQAMETYAQNARLSLHAEEETVGNILKQIEESSDFDFFYNNNHVDLNRRVSISTQDSDIFAILDEVFAGTDVRYTVLDKKIILSTQLDAQQQAHVVRGKVVDSNGEPIIGASVLVKGTTNGVITDMDGKFVIEVPVNAILQISFIGYKSQNVNVSNQRNLTITLREDNEILDEVVVIGYGAVAKKNLTTSISKVEADAVSTAAVSNMSQMLMGRAAGLQATMSSPQPGGNVNISVRGGGEPIYVIDGIIMPSSSLDNTSLN